MLSGYKSEVLNRRSTFNKMAGALQLTVFALLLTIALASSASNLTRMSPEECTFPGVFCRGCEKLTLCVEIKDKLVAYDKATCVTPSEPCSASLGKCSSKTSFCTEEKTFQCVMEGVFPDPYDCNVYHECGVDDVASYSPKETRICDLNTAFNPTTGKCDLQANAAKCGEDSYPVRKCEVTDIGVYPVEADPHFYSICRAGDVFVLKCPDGKFFNEANERCEAEDEEEASEASTEGPEGPSGAFQCAGAGREPDPQSCTRYYDCSDPKKPVRLACPWPQYFHQRKGKCVLGVCPY